jgi:hypothetical protein
MNKFLPVMKKKYLPLLLLMLLFIGSVNAQTWDGSTNTSWNEPTNWTPANVPIAADNVTIPGTVNKPVLENDITLNNFTMSAGSAIDFNGFTLTTNGSFDINGGTLNNTNAGADITITINGTGSKYIRLCTVNDNIIFNYNGTSGGIYEAYQNPNTFNSNVTFNIAGAAGFYCGYDAPSVYNGSVTINRTIAGANNIFVNGFTSLAGNFSYTNTAGGATVINNANIFSPALGGTVNITATGTGNPAFTMRQLKNATGGGTISVQNGGTMEITNDTLLLTAFNINGFTGGGTDDFDRISITGTIDLSDDATNTGSTYVRGSIFNGNSTFTINAPFYEAYSTAGNNTYNGNAVFNFPGTAVANICYENASAFLGNVTVTRTGAGVTNIFDEGFTALSGNFSYTNNAGGATTINSTNTVSPTIGGTVNVTATGTGNPAFTMRQLKNATGGGTVSVQNSGTVEITNDTLLLNAFNINGFTGGGTDDFDRLSITGTVNISDIAGNTGSIYLRRSALNGDVTYTQNSAASFFESYQGSNVYNGNVSMVRNNGTINFAYDAPSRVNQNLSLNSTTGIVFTDTVKFGGALNAIIEQLGTQPIIIPKLQMLKTAGATLTLNDSVTITTKANFTSGNINTSANNELIFADAGTHAESSAASHVNGPVVKTGNDAFTFPIGGTSSLNPVSITAPGVITDRFSARYFLASPSNVGDTSLKAPGLLRITGCEYWEVLRENGTSNETLTFTFGDPCAANVPFYINDPTSVNITRWTGAIWEDLGNGGSTGTTSGTIATGAAVSNFGAFSFASTNVVLNPVPLKLISFNARKVQDMVQLNWQTENELNCSHFEIEKWINGSVFSKMNTTTAKNLPGKNNYVSLDDLPAPGINYYRLKSIDLDGHFTYSNIIRIDFSKKFSVVIAPNPVRDILTIQDAFEFNKAQVIDVHGRLLISSKINNLSHQVNTSVLAPGSYVLRLSGDTDNYTIPFIKQ